MFGQQLVKESVQKKKQLVKENHNFHVNDYNFKLL